MKRNTMPDRGTLNTQGNQGKEETPGTHSWQQSNRWDRGRQTEHDPRNRGNERAMDQRGQGARKRHTEGLSDVKYEIDKQ